MTKILHIETATHICSTCISEDERILAIRETDEPNSHSKILTVFISELLKELDIHVQALDALALSLGPGSYTGLRIGASVIKGLAYGSTLPVIGIDTLEVLTNRILSENNYRSPDLKTTDFLFRPMIDARRMEVYSALYNQTLQQLHPVEAIILDVDSFQEELEKQTILFFGDGAEKAREIIRHPNAIFLPEAHPSSAFMPSLAMREFRKRNFLNTAYFEPFYLKDFIATIPKNKVIPTQSRRGKSEA